MLKYKSLIFIILFVSIVLTNTVFAQECGPSCPVCSGGGDSSGALMAKNNFLISGMYLPTGDEEKGVVSLKYGLFTWMDLGAGYTFLTKKPLWSLRISPLKEGKYYPAIILGTGSVQTGGSDQSLYLQLTKSFEVTEWFGFRISGGTATGIPEFDKIYGLTSLSLSFFEILSPYASYDGSNFHAGLAWVPLDWLTVSVLYAEMEYPAISVGMRFQLWGKTDEDEHGHDDDHGHEDDHEKEEVKDIEDLNKKEEVTEKKEVSES